jgi:hypothetical protein
MCNIQHTKVTDFIINVPVYQGLVDKPSVELGCSGYIMCSICLNVRQFFLTFSFINVY